VAALVSAVVKLSAPLADIVKFIDIGEDGIDEIVLSVLEEAVQFDPEQDVAVAA
jgi:hypothetical protein